MSKEINDGGPAFPRLRKLDNQFNKPWVAETVGGMNLRDWFAGRFFAAVLSDREQWLCHMGDKGATPAYDYVASEAYQMADAMLKAREAQS